MISQPMTMSPKGFRNKRVNRVYNKGIKIESLRWETIKFDTGASIFVDGSGGFGKTYETIYDLVRIMYG